MEIYSVRPWPQNSKDKQCAANGGGGLGGLGGGAAAAEDDKRKTIETGRNHEEQN